MTQWQQPHYEHDPKVSLALDTADHIARAKAFMTLLKENPDYAITVEVAGLKMGLCDTEGFFILMESEIIEAEKARHGQPNKFE